MRAARRYLCAQCFAEALGKNRPDQRGNAKRQEIDRTGCTPLDLVGIHLFDDGVRDHGGTGSHTEDEQREPSGKECRSVNQLHEADQHDRGAAEIDRLAATEPVCEPAEKRAAEHPSERHHRNGEDGISKGKQLIGLEEAHAPDHVPYRGRDKQQPGGKAAKVGLRIREDDFVGGQERHHSLFHAVCRVFPLA
jgi:hypothetical protein